MDDVCQAPGICGESGMCQPCLQRAAEEFSDDILKQREASVPYKDFLLPQADLFVRKERGSPEDTGNHVVQYVCRACQRAHASQVERCGGCGSWDSRRGPGGWRVVLVTEFYGVRYQHEPCGLVRSAPQDCEFCRTSDKKLFADLNEQLKVLKADKEAADRKIRNLTSDLDAERGEISRAWRRLRRANELIDEMRESLPVKLAVWWRRRPWRRD